MNILSETLDTLYQRHRSLATRIDWGYHRLLPWERGRNFLDHPWAPDQGTLSPELTLAVETAMLTEVNLPWFTHGLTTVFDQGPSALKQFVHTWTREEDQHARILDVYLLLSRNGDPDARDAVRKSVLESGWHRETDDPFALMVYTSLQELATRVFYLNLARAVDRHDSALAHILRALAKDETLHYTFYRDATKAYIEEDPGRLVTVCRVIPKFVMPGFGMPDFRRRIKVIGSHAGYGVSAYYDQVLRIVLEFWGVLEHETSSATREARIALDKHLARLRNVIAHTPALPAL